MEQDQGAKQGVEALYAALAQAQSAAQAVGKNSRNQHHNYAYASAEDVITEARGALAGAGLLVVGTRCVTAWEEPVETDGKIRRAGKVACFYRLAHRSGAFEDFGPFETTTVAEKGRPEDKGEFGARTEALAYFLRDLLLMPRILPEGDVSGRNDSEREPAGKAHTISSRAYGNGPARVPFGVDKGKALTEIQPHRLEWLKKALETSLTDPDKEEYRAKNEKDLAAVNAELARRAAGEQGSDEPPKAKGDASDDEAALLEHWRGEYRTAAKQGGKAAIDKVHAAMLANFKEGDVLRAQLTIDYSKLAAAMQKKIQAVGAR